MPVWHVSVSAWSRRTETRLDVPQVCEREAIRVLRGAGGEREWWYWNRATLIGHLRIGLTDAEFTALPQHAGGVLDDAGESGPERKRTLR
jgi:hypothetical protein